MVGRASEAVAAPRAQDRRAEGAQRLAVEVADDGVADLLRQRRDDGLAGQAQDVVAAARGPARERRD